MEALEQEVKLARQQCEDLKLYRLKLYEETEKIEKISIKNLKDKLQRIKGQHQGLSQQLKGQKLTNQRISDQLAEYEHKTKKTKQILKMFSQDFDNKKTNISNMLGDSYNRGKTKRNLDPEPQSVPIIPTTSTSATLLGSRQSTPEKPRNKVIFI